MTHLLAMSNWYPRTRLWIWRLPFIMKEFTKTYPSQKMGIDFFLQIVVTKASVYNYTYRYTYICYYCTSPDRLNRQQLIIRKKIQWFKKKSKVYCWNLGNKVHWPSNNTIVKCFYFVAIYPILKKNYLTKKKCQTCQATTISNFFLFPEEPLLSALWKGSIIGLFPLEFEGLETKSPFEAFEGQYGSNFKP